LRALINVENAVGLGGPGDFVIVKVQQEASGLAKALGVSQESLVSAQFFFGSLPVVNIS
jgi:hypothetical protein